MEKGNDYILEDGEKATGTRLLQDEEIEAAAGGGEGGAGIGSSTRSMGVITINRGTIVAGVNPPKDR